MPSVKIKNYGKSTYSGIVDINNRKINLAHNDEVMIDLNRAMQLTQAYPRDLKIIKENSIDEFDNGQEWKLLNIPKICSFYWGNKTLPYLRMMSMVSFHKLNPDWEIRLYVPMNHYEGSITWKTGEQDYKINTPDYFDYMRKNYPEIKIKPFDFKSVNIPVDIPENFKSDFIRWFLLWKLGGLWSDNDIIYIKPMTAFNKNQIKYYNKSLWLCFNNGYHSCGFLMSAPENVFFKNLFDYAKANFKIHEYQSAGPDLFAKFNFNNIKVLESYRYENIDMDIVYPYDSLNIEKIFNECNSIPENSIGLHWYAGHKLAEKYINNLNENNYHKYNNTLTSYLDVYYKQFKENKFKIITTINSFDKRDHDYFMKCYESIKNQTYKNWDWIIINNSNVEMYSEGFNHNENNIMFKNVLNNSKLKNIQIGIYEICKDDEDIIIMVDGDDWLSDNNVLSYLNDVYNKDNVWITYGQFEPTSKTYSNYCQKVDTKSIRKNGKWLTSHLKTFKYKLWKNIKEDDLKNSKGEYYRSDDVAFMTPMLEMAGNKHSKFIDKVLYVYNDQNINVGMNLIPEQMENEKKEIFSKSPYQEIDKPKISIIITTFHRTNLLKWNLESLSKQNIEKNYDYEILILDEGNDEKEIKDLIGNYKNVKYIETWITKKNPDYWRCPSYALNIGVKQSNGDYIIMMCAEIYSFNETVDNFIRPLILENKIMTIPNHAKDDAYNKLMVYLKKGEMTENIIEKECADLNTLLPFMMGFRKSEWLEIGGYDEDFIGIAYDDTDMMDRLILNGNKYLKVDAFIIHLWHDRIFNHQDSDEEIKKRVEYNKKLYNERKGIIKRNVGKQWGLLDKLYQTDIKMTMTFTTCKRYDLFERTIKSFFDNCLDLDLIQDLIVVDDCSSESDISRMIAILNKTGKPYKFIEKTEIDKGHGKSINILFDEIKTDYWFQCEDDWEFVVKDNFIRKALQIMDNDQSIKEFVFRWGDNGAVGQKLLKIDNIEYYKYNYNKYSKDKEGKPAWIGWNLNPGIQLFRDIKPLGKLKESKLVEWEFSKRFHEKGYFVAYFPKDICKHIGQNNSAYVLNKTEKDR